MRRGINFRYVVLQYRNRHRANTMKYVLQKNNKFFGFVAVDHADEMINRYKELTGIRLVRLRVHHHLSNNHNSNGFGDDK